MATRIHLKPNNGRDRSRAAALFSVARLTPTTMNIRKEIKAAIEAIREDNGDLIASMPTDATTPGQEELKRKHGSPRAFAQACNNAIGTISCLEAHTAIQDYLTKWNAA